MAAIRFPTNTIKLQIAADIAPAARAKLLADTARAGLADLIASKRASPKYRTFVDGVKGRSEDQVRADGQIAYQFNYMGEIISFALEFLKDRSPVASGRYQDSFRVSVNGRDIMAGQFNPRMVPDDAGILIYNEQPYGRKVDVQLVGRKKLTYSVPPGLFADARDAVRARYGNLVSAERLYTIEFPGRKITKRTRAPAAEQRSQRGRRVEYPALSIGPR